MTPTGSPNWSAAGLTLLAVLPTLILALLPAFGIAIPPGAYEPSLALAALWLLIWLSLAARKASKQLRLLANLLQALREGDYGSRVQARRGAMGDVWQEFNALAGRLGGEERRGFETDALLSQLLASLEVAILIFDERSRIVDLNPAAEHLLGEPAAQMIGGDAAELGLSDWLEHAAPFIARREFPFGEGPWEVRRVVFRRRGRPHHLMVVTDVSRTLREEERNAWRRLIRVLGHEINNSLGSIQSTANLLSERCAHDNAPFREGLELIERRSRALGGFIRRYAELAHLPPPAPERVELWELIRDITSLEKRLAVHVESHSPMTAYVDRAQLEQALINIIRNAADAASETRGGVRVRWRRDGNYLLIEVEDDGPGISHTENLYVPFFTTKPGGSGIGLVLARQIIEAHGGTLRLTSRQEAHGTTALIRLPADLPRT